jgi:hypothetical protein
MPTLRFDVGSCGLTASSKRPDTAMSSQLHEFGTDAPSRALNQDGIAVPGGC